MVAYARGAVEVEDDGGEEEEGGGGTVQEKGAASFHCLDLRFKRRERERGEYEKDRVNRNEMGGSDGWEEALGVGRGDGMEATSGRVIGGRGRRDADAREKRVSKMWRRKRDGELAGKTDWLRNGLWPVYTLRPQSSM